MPITTDVLSIETNEFDSVKIVNVKVEAFEKTPEIAKRPRVKARALVAVGLFNTVEDYVSNPRLMRFTSVRGKRVIKIQGAGIKRVTESYAVVVNNT